MLCLPLKLILYFLIIVNVNFYSTFILLPMCFFKYISKSSSGIKNFLPIWILGKPSNLTILYAVFLLTPNMLHKSFVCKYFVMIPHPFNSYSLFHRFFLLLQHYHLQYHMAQIMLVQYCHQP